eukprot:1392421-Amorphochlora_amoeboformis.AAC.1
MPRVSVSPTRKFKSHLVLICFKFVRICSSRFDSPRDDLVEEMIDLAPRGHPFLLGNGFLELPAVVRFARHLSRLSPFEISRNVPDMKNIPVRRTDVSA